jgi:hypothetical protein
MKIYEIAFILFVATAHLNVAYANDSSAELGAGGIVLKKLEGVRIKSEELRISLKKISVHYVFENTTDHDIETEVAFPIPPYIASESMGFSEKKFKGEDVRLNDPEILDFTSKVNGKEIAVEKESRAFLGKREVTENLKDLGVNVESIDLSWSQISNDVNSPKSHVVKLGSAAKKALLKQGLIDDLNHGMPTWTVKTNFHWHQIFPAKKSIEIDHVYSPSKGFTPISELEGPLKSKAEVPRDFGCPDQTVKTELQKMLSRHQGGSIEKQWVKYILVTAKNWDGPIEKFHLYVTPEKNEVVSTCEKRLSKEKNGSLSWSQSNFIPADDLTIFFYNE